MNIVDRLNNVLKKDKNINPEYMQDVIKSDCFYLINNYFDVAFEDIIVNVNLEDGLYSIDIKMVADRIKSLKTIP